MRLKAFVTQMTFNYYKCYLIVGFFSILLAIASVVAPQIELAIASSKSPYDSGYDHGCDDADISDPDDRYINQPEKGPSFHTNEFMNGYHDGFSACSQGGGSGGGGSCYDRGYEDALDHPFDSEAYEECGRAYYSGFKDGCLAVAGNDLETCESATD